jgi:AAA domain
MDEKLNEVFEKLKAEQAAAADKPIYSQSLGEFMASHTPADYLIDGMMRRGWLYACTAPGTTGKTALAELLTKLAAQTKRPAFFGLHEVEHGKVAYFAGENPDDLRERFMADLDLSPITVPDDAVRFFPALFNIDTAYAQVEAELGEMGGVDLLIIDTSAAWFTKFGADENSNDEGGKWARVLRSLTKLPGRPTVLVLCHPTKYVTEPALLMPRGGSVFFLELDGNATLWKDRESGLLTLSQNRWRGVEFEPMTLRTELITSSKVKTAKGVIMPTIRMVVVTPHEEEIAKQAGRANSDTVLEAMLGGQRLSQTQIAVKCGWGDSEGARSKVRRALNNLKDRKLAAKDGDDWQLTRSGKAAAKELKEACDAKKQF